MDPVNARNRLRAAVSVAVPVTVQERTVGLGAAILRSTSGNGPPHCGGCAGRAVALGDFLGFTQNGSSYTHPQGLILERDVVRHGGGALPVNHASLLSVDQPTGQLLAPGRRASTITWFIEKGLCRRRTTWGTPGVDRYVDYLTRIAVWRGDKGEENLSTGVLTALPLALLPGVPQSDSDLPSGGEWDDIKESAYWGMGMFESGSMLGEGFRAARLFPCGPMPVPVCGANFGMGGAVVRIRHSEQYSRNMNWHLSRNFSRAKNAGKAAEPEEYFEAIRAAKAEAIHEVSQVDCSKASRTEKDSRTGKETTTKCPTPERKIGFPFVRAFVLQDIYVAHDRTIRVANSYALALAQAQVDCSPLEPGETGKGTPTPPDGGGNAPTPPGGGSGGTPTPPGGRRPQGTPTVPSSDHGLPPVAGDGCFFTDEGDERIRAGL